MPDCPTCGLPYNEGDTLCPQCGIKLPVKVKTVTCKICGNTLNETAEFCNICGTPTGVNKTVEEEIPKEDLSNPTMDEIQIPVITDDTPGLQEVTLKDENTPTMDSIYMPGAEPAPVIKPAAITPEEQAPVAKAVTAPVTPTIAETPKVSGNVQEQTVNTSEENRTAAQQENTASTPNSTAGNAPYIPHATHNPNVVPGKKISEFMPVILIVAIILVILIDVFVIFRKQIFGGDKANSGCATAITLEAEEYSVT